MDVELLTLQIRLLVCSVDKAREIGVDWWTSNPAFQGPAHQARGIPFRADIEERLARMEATLSKLVTPGS